jgi:hypothetical protein
MCDGSTTNVRGVVAYIGTYFLPEQNTARGVRGASAAARARPRLALPRARARGHACATLRLISRPTHHTRTAAQINVALEFMDGGSLEALLARTGSLPEGVLARVAADVLEGLAWLHRDKRMIHRDIKPANILLNLAGEPKITDFGISTGLDRSASVSHSTCSTYKGTMCYMSPERISNKPYGFNADVWSLGLTLAECALGQYPWRTDQGPVGTMMEIMEGDLPVGAVSGSPQFRDFLALCLRREPAARPAADGLRAHPWVCRAAVPHATVAAFVASVFDPDEALLSLGQMFAAHFYRLLDGSPAQRTALAGLYAPDAALALAGGARACGPEAICALLASSLGDTSHTPVHVDCQAWGAGGVLVHVTGTVIAAFESAPFSDVFALLPGAGDGRWFLAQHWRAQHAAARAPAA